MVKDADDVVVASLLRCVAASAAPTRQASCISISHTFVA